MRAVSLSDNRIITLLNRAFVSVFTSNEDYRGDGSATPDERQLLAGIHQDGLKKGLSVGSVHAYVLSPDGSVLDSLHTAEAAKAERLLKMLQTVAKRYEETAGPLPAAPAATTTPKGDRGLGIRVIARYLEKRGDELTLVENAGGNWSALPGEDTLWLTADESARLITRDAPGVKADRELFERILLRFYPPTENNNLATNRMEDLNIVLDGKTNEGGNTRVRFHGRFRMKHPFYHRDDSWRATATFEGYCDVESGSWRVRRFRMVTDSATYSDGAGSSLPFGIAARELP